MGIGSVEVVGIELRENSEKSAELTEVCTHSQVKIQTLRVSSVCACVC